MGTLKLRHELREDLRAAGRGMGRDKFFALLGQHDLLIRRRRKYAVTTNSNHAFYKHGNELKGKLITAPEQAHVSDITYLAAGDKFVYLSLVTDVYSRKIVGWDVSESLAVEGALRAARQALKSCTSTQGLIHHSDRGIQYCCHAYTGLLRSKQVTISMGEAGNCYDNAIAERVNGILKSEYLLDSRFKDYAQAVKGVKQAVYLYNYERPHWSLGLQKPAEIHEQNRCKETSDVVSQGRHDAHPKSIMPSLN